jgi:hypothetical protein
MLNGYRRFSSMSYPASRAGNAVPEKKADGGSDHHLQGDLRCLR